MAGITSSLESLISSIVGVFRTLLESIFSFFQAIFVIIINMFKSVIDLVGGFLGFILSNIVILGLFVGGYYVYQNYVVRSGGARPAGQGAITRNKKAI